MVNIRKNASCIVTCTKDNHLAPSGYLAFLQSLYNISYESKKTSRWEVLHLHEVITRKHHICMKWLPGNSHLHGVTAGKFHIWMEWLLEYFTFAWSDCWNISYMLRVIAGKLHICIEWLLENFTIAWSDCLCMYYYVDLVNNPSTNLICI